MAEKSDAKETATAEQQETIKIQKAIQSFVMGEDGKLDASKALLAIKVMKGTVNRLVDALVKDISGMKISD